MEELSKDDRQYIINNWKALTPENQKIAREQLKIFPPEEGPGPLQTGEKLEKPFAPGDPRAEPTWAERHFLGRSGRPLRMRPTFTPPPEETIPSESINTGEKLERPFPPGDPRAESTWYQRYFLGKGQQPSKDRESYFKDLSLPPIDPQDTLQIAASVIPPMYVAAKLPPRAPEQVLSQLTPMYRNFLKIADPVARAYLIGLADRFGVELGNLINPRNARDPGESQALTTGTEYVFGSGIGRAVEEGVGAVGRSLRDSPQGRQLRRTAEDIGVDLHPGMTTKNPFLRATTSGLEHSPGGGELRTARETAQDKIDQELLRRRSEYPGGKVTEFIEQEMPLGSGKTMLDIEPQLRPQLPVTPKTRSSISNKLTRYQTPHSQDDIDEVPGLVKERLFGNKTAGTTGELGKFEAETRRDYERLTREIDHTEIPWHLVKKRVPYITLENTVPYHESMYGGNFFDETRDILQAMTLLPDTVGLSTALDIQRMLMAKAKEVTDHLARIDQNPALGSQFTPYLREKVAPALGQALQQVNEWVTPLTVNIQPGQATAREVITRYEQSGVRYPQQVPAGTPQTPAAIEPDYITAARDLLERPAFVTFDEAHALRSDFLRAARVPGMNVGNTAAEEAKKISTAIDRYMEQAGNRLAGGRATQLWRDADRRFREGVQIWNSDLMMDLSTQSLDDILTGIIRNERPNDMSMLREVIGDPLWGRINNMWETRVLEASRDLTTNEIIPERALKIFQELTPWGEQAAFPYDRLGPLKRDLQEVQALNEGLTSTDPKRLEQLKNLSKAGDWKDVGDIRISEIVERNRRNGVVNPDGVLDDLNALGEAAQHIWPQPQRLDPLKEKLRQASSTNKILTENNELLMRQWVQGAGPTAAREAGEVRLAKLIEQAQGDPQTLLDSINKMGSATEQELYGRRLFTYKAKLNQLASMKRALTAEALGDPTLMGNLRRSINDPVAWQRVQGDLLADAFKVKGNTIDGEHLTNYINNVLGKKQGMLQEIFPDPRAVDGLYSLGNAAKVVAQQNETYRLSGIRHHPFVPIVELAPTGAVIIMGHPWLLPGALAGTYVTIKTLSHWLADPTFARKIAAGLHTGQRTRQAFDVAGAIIGALTAHGLAEAPGPPISLTQQPSLPEVGQ